MKLGFRTFNQPAKLRLAGIQHTLNPFIFPGEKLDEFDLFHLFHDPIGENTIKVGLTAPINSLTTCILLSLETARPF
jgi:hypothetical protein